jgi:curved DNA-binding protein CbpA
MNPYEILGVKPDATLVELKVAYKSKAQKMHPDKGGDTESYQALQEAYSILKDPKRRELFDRTGSTDSVDPIEQRVTAEVMGVFDSWLRQVIEGQRPHNEDCVEWMEGQFRNGISNASREKQKMEKVIERLTLIAEKFHGGESDLLNGHVSSRLQSISDQQNRVKGQIEVMEAGLEMLKDIEYDHDKGLQINRPGQQAFTNSSYTTGTNSW